MSYNKNGAKKTSSTQKKSISNLPSKGGNSTEHKKDEKTPSKPTQSTLKTEPKSVKDEKLLSEKLHKESSRTKQNASSSTPKVKTKPSSLQQNSNKIDHPTTPPSNRVNKSKYFPTKNLYLNALKRPDTKHVDVPSKDPVNLTPKPHKPITSASVKSSTKSIAKTAKIKMRDYAKDDRFIPLDSPKINKSKPVVKENEAKTDKRKEIKPVKSNTEHKNSSPETSTVSERPGTATLKKGSMVNSNIAGPEAFDTVKHVLPVNTMTPSSSTVSDDYEDDFDSYESDFETFTSSGGDSTNLSGEETSSAEISKSIEKEKKLDSGTFDLPEFKIKLLQAKIDEVKSAHASLTDEGFEDQKSLQIINFAEAIKTLDKNKAKAAQLERGKQLLEMIKLDTYSFTIFELVPEPYDLYILTHGAKNMLQISSQTGDDDQSEEVQTEGVVVTEKWTQMPQKFSGFDETVERFWVNYKNEYFGVGAEDLNIHCSIKSKYYIENRLYRFLNQAAELIMGIIAEESINDIKNLTKNSRELPFSTGHLEFNTSSDILKHTKVIDVAICRQNLNKILTVHIKTDFDDKYGSVVCVWNVSNLTKPADILISFGEISCSMFSGSSTEIVLGGQQDGSVVVWNTKEKNKSSNRAPCLTTGVGEGHFSAVVSIQLLKENIDNDNILDVEESSEICTLEENGTILFWDFIITNKQSNEIRLIQSKMMNLHEIYEDLDYLKCTGMVISDGHIYVATNYGFILHQTVHGNGNSIKKFISNTMCEATCLEPCPFSSSHLLAGFSSGELTIYSKTSNKPLMILRNDQDLFGASVRFIRWSKTKPFVLFTTDSLDNVHIWNLKKSDMFPEYSIPFSENISCMRLSPVVDVELKEVAYMIVGTAEGKIYLHLLNDEYGQESYEEYDRNVNMILDYVDRL